MPTKKSATEVPTPAETEAHFADCGCGCGNKVGSKKARFLPGHDASLRSKLLKLRRAEAARDNDDSPKPKTERQQAYKEALAALAGVDLDEAFKWLDATHG